MDSFIETFHIDWKILIAQAINFAVVFVVLYLFAVKPLKKIMTERSQRIERGLSDAKTNAEVLEKTEKEYESIIARAKIEANEIFQAGKKEAEDNKAKMIEVAKEDVQKMIENGKKTLESERIKMVEEAKKEVVDLVVKATEKLLESNQDSNLNTRTLEQIKNL